MKGLSIAAARGRGRAKGLSITAAGSLLACRRTQTDRTLRIHDDTRHIHAQRLGKDRQTNQLDTLVEACQGASVGVSAPKPLFVSERSISNLSVVLNAMTISTYPETPSANGRR